MNECNGPPCEETVLVVSAPHELEAVEVVRLFRRERVQLICKDNTSQDFFRCVNLYKEFAYRSEIE